MTGRVLIEAAEIVEQAWERERRRQLASNAGAFAVLVVASVLILAAIACTAAELYGAIR